ncbi:MAG: Jag N-terminal domain-containing protein [Sulfuricurvum sp.]|nr:Jag N-terminal domain-containing protein [Sulfuricurvum sp.]MDP3023797.1 Jag N-terminal domain-containing protein [Sulfuricurvum sp.]MDP3120481.1 Jag N-terminal domain-containing protein [Sulfuricurvum sp.]
MKKIEALSLEQAYAKAAAEFGCSVTMLQVEIVQFPSKGILGLFKKSAIIVANLPTSAAPIVEKKPSEPVVSEEVHEEEIEHRGSMHNDVLLAESFVTEQENELDEDDEDIYGDYDDQDDYEELSVEECALEVKEKINELFKSICFDLHEIDVSAYDENTLLVEITGVDSALMIGKEGYRYKALSYMLFNWINATYGLQLRLEIAEFLKNQEESISRYLVGVCEGIEREGRGQTKTLDGVLVQIALKQLRDRYPDRYVAIRSTRDGGKFIVINSYHEY